MKWNASSFLENRVFDRRLVKDNLVDKWNIYGDAQQRRGQDDYRQFLESYVKFLVFVVFVCVYFGLFGVVIIEFFSELTNFFVLILNMD